MGTARVAVKAAANARCAAKAARAVNVMRDAEADASVKPGETPHAKPDVIARPAARLRPHA
jgi:hypothetical protein